MKDLSRVPIDNLLTDILKPVKKDWGPVNSYKAVRKDVKAVLKSHGVEDEDLTDDIVSLVVQKHEARIVGLQKHLKRYRNEIARRIDNASWIPEGDDA